MKKTLAAAITSALVIGVASTTFAAANPFSDVPTDHWSFDAVAKLAHEGVIEGYGDNTFRGDAKITRYEMAQMVAKAMAKENVSAADKATIDKLSAEYADELNNLGVRVAALEKKTDNVKITGLLRLDGAKVKNDGEDDDNSAAAKLRLNISAQVNDNWAVKGRLEGDVDLKDGGTNDDGVTVKHAYAEGPLFGATAQFGKFDIFDANNLTNGGIVIDTQMSGAQFTFGDKLTTKVSAGRLTSDSFAGTASDLSKFYAAQFGYNADALALGAGYQRIDGAWAEKNNIWNAGFDYKLNDDLTLGCIYAKSDLDATNDDQERAYSAQLTYKGAKSDVVGSYGTWVAYREIGENASFAPTYDGVGYGQKGYEIGVDYMVDKNILTKLVYFDGEYIDNGQDTSKIFGRVEFQF